MEPLSEFEYPITINQGETFVLPIEYVDSDGDAIDIRNYTAKMQIRPTVASDVVLSELTTENGKILISGLTGRIDLTIPAAETEALEAPASAVYDLFIVSNSGIATRLLRGPVTITQAVTRDA